MCVHALYMRTKSLTDRVSCMCIMYIMCIMCIICVNKPTWELISGSYLWIICETFLHRKDANSANSAEWEGSFPFAI